jgi:excisionase family DNA binding protein
MNSPSCYNATSPLGPGLLGHSQRGADPEQPASFKRTDSRSSDRAGRPPLVTIEDVAARLAISKTGVYRLVARHAIPFHRVGGLLRFDVDEIEAHLRENRVSS